MLTLNKIIFLLLLITFACSQKISHKTRDFLTAYFGVINGKDWQINEDCFGGQFEDYLGELHVAVLRLNIFSVVKILDKMIVLELDKCPINEGVEIYKDMRIAMRNGSFFKNSLKNYSMITIKIEEFLESDRCMKQMGVVIGYITKMLVYGTAHSSYVPDLKNEFISSLKFLQ